MSGKCYNVCIKDGFIKYPEASPKGGTRKRRGAKKSNGHKANCKCPICKNMRKGKKTRRKH